MNDPVDQLIDEAREMIKHHLSEHIMLNRLCTALALMNAQIKHGIAPVPPVAKPERPELGQRLLSRAQVAERWGVCIHTVARMKELKPISFNRQNLRYRLEDVLRVEKERQC